MSVFHTLPPTCVLFPSISLGELVRGLFRCLLSLGTAPGLSHKLCDLISAQPSATPFDIQGIPGLMHCKFSSIMNCMRRIKGMDMEHTLQRNVRGSKSANEPKLAIRRGLAMSDVQAAGQRAHAKRYI